MIPNVTAMIMPSGYPPSVFVSSTCYDLGQVRQDLKLFIESLGYVPVISESPAFPVNPQADNIENCIRAVKDRADLFVLVVGGRYGTQTSDGRSITNHEYLEAKEKGVPIFVFVTQSILHNLPIWQANPNGDYSGVVDSVKLFEFVQRLRGSEGHWVFAFSHASEIANTLKTQWALLFTDALRERERLKDAKLSPELLDLPVSCLRVLLEKPVGWEYRFFSAVLKTEIKQRASLRRDVQYGLKLGIPMCLSKFQELSHWIKTRLAEITMLVRSGEPIVNSVLKDAFGPAGCPGNPELIAYGARQLGRIYERLLSWTNDFASLTTNDEFARIVLLTSQFSQKLIENFESFPDQIDAVMEKAESARARGEKYEGQVTLHLDIPPNTDLMNEIDSLRQKIENG